MSEFGVTPADLPAFPDDWVFFDLEVAGDTVREIGAIRGRREFRTKSVGAAAVRDFVAFVEGATLLIGHNVWAHDRAYLRRLPGIGDVAERPMLDTLPLSVITHPKRPYHALVKGYKLVRSELSDPVTDCGLAARLLADEARVLRDPDWSQRFALSALAASTTADGRAVRTLCSWLDVPLASMLDATVDVEPHIRAQTCQTAVFDDMRAAASGETDPHAMAYVVAWLSVAATRSVLPRWVASQFPDARRMVDAWRVSSCGAPHCTWCANTNDADAALQRWFGLPAFRDEPRAADGSSLQRAIVRNGLSNRSTFAVLPTGGGKSICFQLPALVRAERTGALTVVLSPLQSLMKDQVDNLREQAESAVGQVNGALTMPERARTLRGIADGRLALVYISPEQLRNKSVRKALEARDIGAWVFDEAHCLSKWGHDFRTDYLYAPRYIREHADKQGHAESPPVYCFTATAQREVVREVCAILEHETGHRMVLLLGGVERDNLTFEVRAAGEQDKLRVAAELIEEHLTPDETGCAVVFAATRKETEAAAAFLREHAHLNATAYHAGLDAHERRALQDAFIHAERAVITATSAFGMGVDKPDVRLVIHLAMPGSLESYLQQAGRAGRDRKPAHCVLLTTPEDAETQFRLARRSRLQHIDIQAIHRSIRRAPARKHQGVRETVVTHVELMRIGSARERFDADDRFEQTRVNTAVSWLERAGLVQRDENVNRVFQGTLRTKTLDEASQKLRALNISKAERARMEAVLKELALAPAGESLSADEIALAAGLWDEDGAPGGGSRVIDLLRDLARLKLLGEHTRYTAIVRHGIADSARERLDTLQALDEALVDTMRTRAPDAGPDLDVHAHLEELGSAVFATLAIEADLRDPLRALWTSYERDGEGFIGGGKSFALTYKGRRAGHAVRVLQSWNEVADNRRRFLTAARVVLSRILDALDEGARGELHVAFDSEMIVTALESDMETRPHLHDPAKVVEEALLLLHESRVFTLQNGLAVFRQAMTVRHHERDSRRQFKQSDYEPLQTHYDGRNTQIHVMAEYARLGVDDMEAARKLSLDWFEMERDAFLKKWMPGRRAELKRATTQRSYDRIVTALKHPDQEAIVTADPQANQLVLAGPGSGKTRVIVHRIAHLVRVDGYDPAGIFALAYNRSAAYEIRRRLRDLIADDARFVRVHTLHGLAARIVGTAPDVAGKLPGDADAAFQRLIERAAEVLESGAASGDLQRERLIGGCSHLLIDEYQDIDASQARLVSAVAGRLVDDGRRLAVLAVGDDDQNIYGFRGSSAEFIKRFAEEYKATTVHLLDNFRSTEAIVSAANHVITPAPGRLKVNAPIRVAPSREPRPFGGRWEELDAHVCKGRVRVVYCDDELGVGDFIADEMLRLNAYQERGGLERFAVLGRTRRALYPVREALRLRNEPCRWTLGHGKGVPIHEVREVIAVMRWLRDRGTQLVAVADVEEAHAFLKRPRAHDPWARLLLTELDAWKDAHGTKAVLGAALAAALRDAVADERRSHATGIGPTLSTLHAAKGLEFPHVFVVPGHLSERAKKNDADEERRLFYVAMTRAKETLTVVVPKGERHPFVEHLARGPRIDRIEWRTQRKAERVEYDLLGLGDFWIDWAGRRTDARTHEALANVHFGTRVLLRRVGDTDWVGVYRDGTQIAALGGGAASKWLPVLDQVLEARVLATIERRRSSQDDPSYRERLKVERWEVPLIEVRRRVK